MRIGVYGTGRFGAFWARELARYAEVVTYNRSPRPVPEGCTGVDLAELGRADAVVLCVAISAVEASVRALRPHLGPGTVVMDTCSVKVYPLSVMLRELPGTIPVFGTHPMFGPDSAGSGVVGLPLVMSDGRVEPRARAVWIDFFRSMGVRVIEMSAEDHDREAAMTQGVTHLLGRVLADMAVEPSAIATRGYERLLEVVEQTCNDPYQLFVDLQRFNPYTSQMRSRLQESLARITGRLDAP